MKTKKKCQHIHITKNETRTRVVEFYVNIKGKYVIDGRGSGDSRNEKWFCLDCETFIDKPKNISNGNGTFLSGIRK